MSKTAADGAKPRKSKRLMTLLLPILFGAAMFGAAFAGYLPLGTGGGGATDSAHVPEGTTEGADPHATSEATADSHASAPMAAPAGTESAAFVEVPPIVISLGTSARARQLHFAAHLEVSRGSEGKVASVMPRIVDVLNGYLRAVEVADLEDRSSLVRLRAQMLRRVRLVAGPDVRNLLVGQFILN